MKLPENLQQLKCVCMCFQFCQDTTATVYGCVYGVVQINVETSKTSVAQNSNAIFILIRNGRTFVTEEINKLVQNSGGKRLFFNRFPHFSFIKS